MNRTYLTFEEVHDAPAVQSGVNDSTRPLTDRLMPTSGVIMCVRCNLPAADCAHTPEWVRRMREGQLRAKALEA